MSEYFAPRKRFGQNFLQDFSVIQSIISTIAPRSTDHLVEIGPGRGAITRPLLQSGCTLDVVEFDRDLIAPLEKMCDVYSELTVHEADALTFDFGSLCVPDKHIRLVGNLPYNISTPLLFHLLTFSDRIADMHFMLQKEVAMRLAAEPGTKEYGRLSVMIQYHCFVNVLFHVGPYAFIPAPKVDSAIVRLEPYRQKPCIADSFEHFSVLVKAAFSMRRKTLRNNLKHLPFFSVWGEGLPEMSRRAEQLSVAEYVALSNAMYAAS